MIKLTCQLIIMVLFIIGFLGIIHRDINGEKARDPRGFAGVVVTIVVFSLLALCYWKAGAFSELLPK